MTIHIKPFENIEEINLALFSKDNPIADYELPSGLFAKEEGNLFFKILLNNEVRHWEYLLNNRLLALNLDFAYSMHYFEKGIPDDEWCMSPGFKGQSVQYYPHFTDEHFSNLHNFSYFVDIFFLKAFTVFETLGHLLYKHYELPHDKDDWRDQISFKSAIFKLNKVNPTLHKELKEITKSKPFSDGVSMRNNIAHNHPPYEISSGVKIKENGGSFGIGDYTTSKEIRRVMIGLLESIKQTFEVLDKNLTAV
ncbi:hypothetical protein JOC78_000614 [Bacillus ectoiniformans]|nr:Cthe_2314 family HEPN domain-containing protein [Bacillus ectoiniformans]MBM7647693.1 hypothetical protein [Bacillus ectoiniformans]